MTAVSYARSKTSSSEAVNGSIGGAVAVIVIEGVTAAGVTVDQGLAGAITVLTMFVVGKYLT